MLLEKPTLNYFSNKVEIVNEKLFTKFYTMPCCKSF